MFIPFFILYWSKGDNHNSRFLMTACKDLINLLDKTKTCSSYQSNCTKVVFKCSPTVVGAGKPIKVLDYHRKESDPRPLLFLLGWSISRYRDWDHTGSLVQFLFFSNETHIRCKFLTILEHINEILKVKLVKGGAHVIM